MDDELIQWCAMATRAACPRMTAHHLKALQDSVGQACTLPSRFAWDSKATAHAQIFNLLADVAADHPVPARLLGTCVGAVHDLLVAVGPAADGIILGSRRRLLALIRAGDADGAAAEMEQHLRGLRFMWRLSQGSAPGGIAAGHSIDHLAAMIPQVPDRNLGRCGRGELNPHGVATNRT